MSNLLKEFCEIIKENPENGDVLEFGTGGGQSAAYISTNINDNRKVFTFDSFQGLPETKKGIPKGTGWEKGAYYHDVNNVKTLLKDCPTIFVHKLWSWELTEPVDYNIDKIIAASIDFDLYEGTLDALNFINKCSWNSLLLRFDDWGCHPHQVAAEVDAHEKAAFFDWIKQTNYNYLINRRLEDISLGMQTIITVNR